MAAPAHLIEVILHWGARQQHAPLTAEAVQCLVCLGFVILEAMCLIADEQVYCRRVVEEPSMNSEGLIGDNQNFIRPCFAQELLHAGDDAITRALAKRQRLALALQASVC